MENKKNSVTRTKKGGSKQQATSGASTPKKMTGPLFYIVLFFTAIDDLFDIFANLAFLGLIASLFSFIITGIIFIYFMIEGVKMGKKKTALWVTGIICELIPIVSIFPTYTINLLITKKIENGDSKFINKLTSGKNITRAKRG